MILFFFQKESRLDSLLHRRARQGDCEGVRQVTWSDPVGGVQVLSIVVSIHAGNLVWSYWWCSGFKYLSRYSCFKYFSGIQAGNLVK